MSSILNSKINLIYQFLNESNSNNCFNISRINLKNITLEDIKIDIENKYRDIFLKDVIENKFQFISYDKKIDTLLFNLITNSYNLNLLITPYNFKSNDKLLDNDCLFSYVLSSLVLQNKTKNIQLPILNIDVKMDEIKEILEPFPIYKKISDNILNNKIKDIFLLRLRESPDSNYYMKEYIEEYGVDNIKEILFQIIHCMYIIQSEYPTFRHNNLTINNLIVNKENIISNKIFLVNDTQYKINNSNTIVYLSSFDNATCYEINNKKLSVDSSNDIITLLNSLKLSKYYSKLDKHTKQFIDLAIKTKSIINLLKDSYFNEYILPIMSLESDNKSMFGNQSQLDTPSKDIEHKLIRREIKRKSKIKINNQTGGNFRKTNYPYSKERNNPNISNDAKNTYNKFQQEKPPIQEKHDPPTPVLAEQKIYDIKNPMSPLVAEQKVYDNTVNIPKVPKPGDFIGNTIPVDNPFNANYNSMHPRETNANQVNIVKPVNITFSNPIGGSHIALNKVYEDMLPGDNVVYSLKSVYERKQLINFVRGMILETGDGEEISVTVGGHKSLLSFLKLIEINPYNLEKNPYKSLSKGFLLYSSAYPVRYDRNRNKLDISKQSLGINIRIYELTKGANEAEKIGNNITCDNFDIWREIKYYEYIREDILKKNISPNFVSMYLYTTDSMSKINYDAINMIRTKNKPSIYNTLEQTNMNKINNLHELDPLQFLMDNMYGLKSKNNTLIDKTYVPSEDKINNIMRYLRKRNYISLTDNVWTQEGIKFLENKNYFSQNIPEDKIYIGSSIKKDQVIKLALILGKFDFTVKIGKSLVALTEAPTSPLLSWASPTSENFGTVQRMTETGYHTPQVWKSIIFQMVYTFAVLQKKNIYFKKMSLENNFFIKDIFVNNEQRDHWIYKVKDINYYIPNYGYILMFDSNYVDIMDETIKTVGVVDSDILKYKIVSDTLYGNTNDLDNDTIKNEIFTAFKYIVNSNNFTTSLDRFGGLKPDSSILDLLNKINSHDDTNIENYFSLFFTEFMHNRIGTILTNDEMSVIGNMFINNFKIGEMVAYRESNNMYKWAIYLGNGPGLRQVNIALNDTIQTISIGQLRKLPDTEIIKQTTKNRVLYDSEYTIETYKL